jgi:hypothetical protein
MTSRLACHWRAHKPDPHASTSVAAVRNQRTEAREGPAVPVYRSEAPAVRLFMRLSCFPDRRPSQDTEGTCAQVPAAIVPTRSSSDRWLQRTATVRACGIVSGGSWRALSEIAPRKQSVENRSIV